MASLSRSQAGTAQIHTKLTIPTRNTPHIHPSSSELPFLPPLLSLPSRKGAAAAAAKVPGVQNAQNHSGTSLALPRQPLARPNPGFSCWGLKTIRFFSSKMFSKESVDYSYSALKMHFKKINQSSRLFKMYRGSRGKINTC